MASKISGQTMYLPIVPYKVDGSSGEEFNELSVTVNFDSHRKHFYVAIHAGWKSSWGGHGCIIMGDDNPLTAPKYVKVKDSPKNSQKTIDEMFARLEQAKEDIAWLFDQRDWTRLYAAVRNIALYGYTEQFRSQMKALIEKTNNIQTSSNNKEDKAMKLNLSNNNNESGNAAKQQVNNAIKREQSGAGSGYAEREHGRPEGNNANEPIVKQVDVMGLMGALSRDGHAKLSDHVIEDAEAVEVKDEQAEEIESVNVGEVTLATIMPKMTAEPEPTKQEVAEAIVKAAETGEATTKPLDKHGTLVIGGVPKRGGEKPAMPKRDASGKFLKKGATEEPKTEAVPKAETKAARYAVQLLPSKSGGVWPKLYGFRSEKEAKAVAEKMPSSVTARWDYGVNGEGRETKTRHWYLSAGKRYCDVMQELADALNKGDRVAVANAAAKACGVYAGVVAENKSKSDAEPKPKREKKQEAKAEEKPMATGYSNADVAAMLKKIMAGGDIPENIKAAMAA